MFKHNDTVRSSPRSSTLQNLLIRVYSTDNLSRSKIPELNHSKGFIRYLLYSVGITALTTYPLVKFSKSLYSKGFIECLVKTLQFGSCLDV